MPDGAVPPGERSAMSEETCTRQTVDTATARSPEDIPALVKTIGKTTYKVRGTVKSYAQNRFADSG